MAERVFLHIGAPKTGTTYLQQVLHLNREALAADGVCYPHVVGDAHHTALWDLRTMWKQREFGREIRGDWDATVRLVDAWDGVAVLSSELFVYAEEGECAQALAAFAAGTEVHVVYTARDLVRQAPAVWQERVKNQYTLDYADFLEDLLGPAQSSMAKGFWRAQDLPTALARWSAGIPAEHVHVVTTPPSGSPPSLLWERFASVLGIDGTSYATAVPAVNTSMSVAAAEVLRRYNESHGQKLTPLQYRRMVRKGLFQVLVDAAGESRLELRDNERAALVQRARGITAAVRARGYDVVGDLEELVPTAPRRFRRGSTPGPGRRPGEVADAEISAVLLDVVDRLLVDQDKLTRKLKRAKKRQRRKGSRRRPSS